MSWTSPRTWVTGELCTSALLNTHLRDNLLETAAAKVTTAGDLTYATGANALARLGIGSAGQALVTNSGATAPQWKSTYGVCRANLSGNQSIPNASTTLLNFGAEDFDPLGWHDNVTNNSRITPTIAGKYLVHGHVWWDINATGLRYSQIYKNGTQQQNSVVNAVGSGDNTSNQVLMLLDMNGSTDYVELKCLQNSGGALNAQQYNGGSPTLGTYLEVILVYPT